MECIITFATADKYYLLGIQRLQAALKKFYRGDFLYWYGVYPDNCPEHMESPWAFKPHGFLQAYNMGYRKILWCDASIRFYASPDGIFQKIDRDGYYFQRSSGQARGKPVPNDLGVSVGQWCSDDALNAMSLSREEAFKIPEIWACCMGLDLEKKRGLDFLNQWMEYALDGVTFKGYPGPVNVKRYNMFYRNKGGVCSKDCPTPYKGYPGKPPEDYKDDPNRIVAGHRHDQTAASVIAYRMGMYNIHTIGRKGNKFFDNEKKLPKRGSTKPPHPLHRGIPLGKIVNTIEPEFRVCKAAGHDELEKTD